MRGSQARPSGRWYGDILEARWRVSREAEVEATLAHVAGIDS